MRVVLKLVGLIGLRTILIFCCLYALGVVIGLTWMLR